MNEGYIECIRYNDVRLLDSVDFDVIFMMVHERVNEFERDIGGEGSLGVVF